MSSECDSKIPFIRTVGILKMLHRFIFRFDSSQNETAFRVSKVVGTLKRLVHRVSSMHIAGLVLHMTTLELHIHEAYMEIRLERGAIPAFPT
jgi:hypothetical protein